MFPEVDGKEHFIKYLKKLEIVDTEIPENKLLFNFWACGSNVDLAKAKGSAETYASKYLLSKFFLMRVKDTSDPDYQSTPKEVKEVDPNTLRVTNILNLLREKMKKDATVQPNFLSKLNEMMEIYGISGQTDNFNIKGRLMSLKEPEYKTLLNYLESI